MILKYFNTLNPDNDEPEFYTAQIKISYYELGCIITNMIKMCVLAPDHDEHIKSDTNKKPVNVSLVLEMMLEMFPLNEFELLGEISEMIVGDSKSIME